MPNTYKAERALEVPAAALGHTLKRGETFDTDLDLDHIDGLQRVSAGTAKTKKTIEPEARHDR